MTLKKIVASYFLILIAFALASVRVEYLLVLIFGFCAGWHFRNLDK